MDAAEEISRQIIQNKGLGRIDRLGVIPEVESSGKFLPNPSLFYRYIRKRIEIFMEGTECAFVGGQSEQIKTYCGMIVHAQNGYFLLCVLSDLSGEMIRLDLSELAEYSVYSGQIAKVTGTNPIGEEIVVGEIVYDIDIHLRMIPEKESTFTLTVINGNRIGNNTVNTVGIPDMVGVSDKEIKNISESDKICEIIKKSTADAIIVIGDTSAEEREKYKKLSFVRNIRVICLPVHDGIESTMAYPGGFIKKVSDASIPSRVNEEYSDGIYDVKASHFLEVQNPSMISMNGVVIGVTSIDMLLGISRKEISRNRKNRMLDIINHTVCQRTFLPFVPHDIPVDYSLYNCFIWPYRPDVLIFPTVLSANMKEVCSTHVVPVNKQTVDMRITCSKDRVVSVDTLDP